MDFRFADLELVRAALALALVSACGESRSPLALDGTSGVSSSESGGNGAECVDNSDCAVGYDCWSGTCEQTCGEPESPACSESHDDGWNGHWEGDGDGDEDVCLSAADCGEEQYCVFGDCIGIDPTPECEAPVFTERSLPAGVEGAFLDLHLVDFDGDGRDSLVLLRAGELLVVEEGVPSSMAVAASLDRVTPLALDEDGVPDLFLTSASAEEAAIVLGSPDAQLTAVEEQSFWKVDAAAVLDWIEGGPEELAIASLGPEEWTLRLVTQLATLPVDLPLDGPAGLETRLEALNFDGDAMAELLVHQVCRWDLLAEAGAINAINYASKDCSFTKVALVDGGLDSIATLIPGNGVDAVRVFGSDTSYQGGLPGVVHGPIFAVEISGLPGQALLASGPDAALLWSSEGEALDCRAQVPALAAISLARSGELDGDGDDELASLDGLGELRLWSISG